MTSGCIERLLVAALMCAAANIAAAIPASAESVAEFYKGKTITLMVGAAPSGGDDVFARTFARYLPRYLPGNPAIIVQNLSGAGGILAATRMASTAPRDGTVIGALMRGVPTTPLLSDGTVNFDSRTLNWLGSLSKETILLIAWHTSQATAFDDAFKRELIVGSTGGRSDSTILPLMFNGTLGTRFKVIRGYHGAPAIDIAMERGELDGRFHTWTYIKGIRPDWMKENKIRILAQLGLSRNSELPDIPNVLDYVKDPKLRAMYEFLFSRYEAARPYIAPPDVPAERLGALRKALADVTADQEFRAEIEKIGGEVGLLRGEALQRMVQDYYALPPHVINTIKALLNSETQSR